MHLSTMVIFFDYVFQSSGKIRIFPFYLFSLRISIKYGVSIRRYIYIAFYLFVLQMSYKRDSKYEFICIYVHMYRKLINIVNTIHFINDSFLEIKKNI